ncbi:(2Fe-2S)-binding protein, partial [Halorubrum distributum]
EEAEGFALTCMARRQSDLKLDRGKYPPSIEDDAATAAEDGDGTGGADGAAADDD